MKKKLLLISLIAILLLPITSFAKSKEETSKYTSTNLEETLTSAGIELANKNYKENDKQVKIYLFRGASCSYCHAFLEYLNSISEEYGKYFKLEAYEVWEDNKNIDLYDDVVNYLNKRIGQTKYQSGSVPLIIIGEEVFQGYSEVYNENIIATIKNEYNAKEKYDVMEEKEKQKKIDARNAFFESSKFSIICSTVITIIVTVSLILYFNNEIAKLNRKIARLEKKTVPFKEERRHEEKEEVKEEKNLSNKNNAKKSSKKKQ